MEPASQCGGDWWGYIEVPNPSGGSSYLVMMIGDVEGHGTAQALITGGVQGALGMLAPWLKEHPECCSKPEAILDFFNQSIFGATKGALTMTFTVAMIDRDARLLRVANAGHPFPYVLRPTGEGGALVPQAVTQAGIPLGSAANTLYDQHVAVPWQPGSHLFLYTDGLVQCIREGEPLFTRKELRQTLVEFSSLKGNEFFSKVMSERRRRISDCPQKDDVSAVVCMELPVFESSKGL